MTERLADAIEAHTEALRAIEQRIQVVGDTLEEIRIEFSWLVRNGINMPSETLSCATCDTDSPDSLAEALKQGWTRLQYDPENLAAHFLGICPCCQPKKQVPETDRASFLAEFKRKSDAATDPYRKQNELF